MTERQIYLTDEQFENLKSEVQQNMEIVPHTWEATRKYNLLRLLNYKHREITGMYKFSQEQLDLLNLIIEDSAVREALGFLQRCPFEFTSSEYH